MYARYYGGNQHIDELERLCQRRALDLLGLDEGDWSVNVQPYSGSPANFAVYTALLKPHERIMGLDLPSGGHLTHGYQTVHRKVSATSVYFESMPYRVNPTTGLIDYDEMTTLARAFKPKLMIAGASAYPRDWDYARMRTIADSVGAYLMADIAHTAGFIATGLMCSPFTHCDVVTTTTHKSLRGPRSGMIFCRSALKQAVDQAVFPGLQGGPHNNQIGMFGTLTELMRLIERSAYQRLFRCTMVLSVMKMTNCGSYTAAVAVALKEAKQPAFSAYMKRVKSNAVELARCLKAEGFTIATKGTSNHIVLWDARDTGLSGAKLEKLLEMVDIYVNKNTLPADTSALNPGGVRLGTLAMTTRGVRCAGVREIAEFITRTVRVGQEIQTACAHSGPNDTSSVKLKEFLEMAQREGFATRLAQIRDEVHAFTADLPMPSPPMARGPV